MHRVLVSMFLGALLCSSAPAAHPHHRMTPELLWKLGRLGSTALSSDGSTVAYSVRRYKLEENKGTSTLFALDVKSGKSRAIVRDWPVVSDVQFAKTPFGERIYFVGRPASDKEGAPQVWTVSPADGASKKVTNYEDGVSNLKVSPTGNHIAFTRDIKLDDDVHDLYKDLPKADARIIDSLMFRHWNQWHDYKYSHLHVAAIDSEGLAGEATDLMPKLKADCPVPPFAGSEHFNWHPNGKQIAYTAKIVKDWAESTNSAVYVVDVNKPGDATNVTRGRPGYDNDPVYSPDGKYLAYHSMARASFEADRNMVMVLDTSSRGVQEATAGLDQMAHGAMWKPDGSGLVFTSEWRGTNQVFSVDQKTDGAKQLSEGVRNYNLIDLFPDGKRALVSFSSMIRPYELAILNLEDKSTRTITDINGDVYKELELPVVEERWVPTTDGKQMHCWVIKPPNFDKNKKYPFITYCQGGPQGQIGQWFSYRWNFHLMAAQGYVVVAPNRRGLPGFGREWNDQISKDWGGQAMKDILSATDSMLTEPYVDKERTAAIGASFGGYTVYWLMGNHNKRFKTMIAHCGVFNLESMYGSTEELFFVNWDLGGPYWSSQAVQDDYNKFSPHRFIRSWDTPLLVIHGEKDFRVPVTQGMEAFTAAQVKNIPSRFLYYPEEGHWVLGPQNGVLWHRVFFDWLGRYAKPNGE